MPKKCYHVQLTTTERTRLLGLLRRGTHPARQLMRARVLLLADENRLDDEIAEMVQVSPSTVARLRKRYAQEGLEAALSDHPRSGAPPKVTRRLEAPLIALACSEPPAGRARWTLRLLADKVVELGLVEGLSHTSVRRVLKKTS